LKVEEKMATQKTRFPQVKLEELKKIIPEIFDGNENHKGARKPRLSGTPKRKPKA
jgi:AMMECR1 domain-containing protein